MELSRSCPVSWGRVGRARQVPGLAPEHFGVSQRGDCHCPIIHDLPYLCSQLMVLPTHSAPAQTFPVLPARSWSRLRHHMPTGKSIAGKRAQGQLGLMAPARQQKVGRVCLGGSSAGSECQAPKGPAVLGGCLGLGVLLVQGSVVTWGSEHSLSKWPVLRQERATGLSDLPFPPCPTCRAEPPSCLCLHRQSLVVKIANCSNRPESTPYG